jgi:hypothetical protein
MSTNRPRTSSQRTTARKGRRKPQNRPVPEMLLELAYRLHATKVVVRAPSTCDPAATVCQ